ncbi:MAG: hypothetical protein IKT02_04045, partial [Bacteroidales bacterium]|nr:hypothetical protein [Bacteroidales bacterium]
IVAEKYAFFKGAIRFLFQDENGNATENSWNEFNTKWGEAKAYFNENPESKQSVMNSEYDNAKLLKALISRFTPENYWDVLNYRHRTFNNLSDSWRYYLLNNKIFGPIHQIMMGKNEIKTLEKSSDEARNRLYQLSNTDLLDFVMDKIPYSWIRGYHNHTAIFPSSTGIFINADNRDVLLHSDYISICDEYIVPKTKFLFGSDINFKYNGVNFQWRRTDYVYLLDESKNWIIKGTTAQGEKTYYCFAASGIENKDEFVHNLNCLISQANNAPCFNNCPNKERETNTDAMS